MANLLIGRSGDLALYGNENTGVVIDTQLGMIVETGDVATLLSSQSWEVTLTQLSASETLLASKALATHLEEAIVASADRMYSIPKSVQNEAEKALEWHKEHNRGGTPVGMNTAHILAKGGQIGIRKIRHIAKYFPRHEVDKKGKGWAPGEDNFPSNGRIAWALWGGEAGKRWSHAIVEREDKATLTAGAYDISANLDPFQQAHELDENYGPEFLARVDMNGEGIDRLYKVDIDGLVYVWDDECWDNLGTVEGDAWTYDKALDDPYSTVDKLHVLVDPSSALLIAARLALDPYTNVSIYDLDKDEADIHALGMAEEDWSFIDQAVTAAAAKPATNQDGTYTPDERSAKAANQARNSEGEFAKQGQRVAVGGDLARGSGKIDSVDSTTGKANITLDNGKSITVNTKDLVPEDKAKEQAPAPAGINVDTAHPLDVSGILGEPRTPQNQPKAHLSGTLRPITGNEIHDMLVSWGTSVNQTRASFNAPVTAAAPVVAPEIGKALTPETSDVKPKYIAIVSPQKIDAVMDLVAIVPKTDKTNTPATFKRENQKWVYDEQIYNDLVSATPPPVIELDKTSLTDVLAQMDETKDDASTEAPVAASAVVYGMDRIFTSFFDLEAVVAAGGLDRNRGNAEKLRRYWVHGEGAAKIRWGQKGDWARCVRHLSKYLGERSKGYCQLRHKEATGMYTATHAKMDRAKHNSNEEFIMEEVLTKNYGVPTQVTDKDLLTPIDEIVRRTDEDDLCDKTWTPEMEIHNMMQDEACKKAMTAAGGLDRNRGNAEDLRQYWTHGKGAAKVRWGTPGDWTRCVRHLEKYMGPRAKGYCQLRHKEATGVYTGSHLNPGKKTYQAFSSAEDFNQSMINLSVLTAKANEARERFHGLVASAGSSAGARFFIPTVIPEGIESGDGRKFDTEAIDIRTLPLPLMWQIKTGEGHNGSVVVGRIDHMERTENGIGSAYGVFDTGAFGREAQRLVENGFIRGVSADLDQFEAKEVKAENAENEEEVGKQKLTINHARVMAVTIVAKPAFQECTIVIQDGSAPADQEENMVPEDGVYEESPDETFNPAEALTASGFLASAIPATPPQEWFEKPKLNKATPLTVDETGRVYGHIAAWHVNHIGMPRSTRPPRSKSKYAYFHTGVVRTDSGKDMPVGQLTLAGGHASLQADARAAAKHYDDTASAIADVHAGEDDYGIWVAGSLRPDATEAQIRALRASAPSGDWRPINGQLELVAVCQVNVPGFPIARAMVAGGQVMALVAAGAHYMAIMKTDAATQLSLKAQVLNELGAYANSMDLVTRVNEAGSKVWEEFTYISRDDRMALAKEGKALPDGSFPIKNVEDVRAAVHAYGRASEEHKPAVRKHIMKRARQLNVRHLIPETWTKGKSLLASAKIEELRQKALIASAITELASISEEERKALAEEGKALPDGSFPIRNESDLKNAIHAYGRAKKSDRAKVRKHIAKRAKQLKVSNVIPDDWKTAASADAESLVASMRNRITEFAEAPVEIPTADTGDKQISESDLKKLTDAKAEADKQTADEVQLAKDLKEGKVDAKDVYNKEGRSGKYTPKTQPRDARGMYRKVLATLKQNYGVAGLQDALQTVQHAQNMDFAGNYTESAKAGKELLGLVDRLDTKALNPKSLENIKATTTELGKVIANLPLPFGDEANKLRFSDLPSGLKDLMKNMITRVEDKIGKKDGQVATHDLKSYMSGADVYSQAEIQSQMNKMLRLLT